MILTDRLGLNVKSRSSLDSKIVQDNDRELHRSAKPQEDTENQARKVRENRLTLIRLVRPFLAQYAA